MLAIVRIGVRRIPVQVLIPLVLLLLTDPLVDLLHHLVLFFLVLAHLLRFLSEKLDLLLELRKPLLRNPKSSLALFLGSDISNVFMRWKKVIDIVFRLFSRQLLVGLLQPNQRLHAFPAQVAGATSLI